MKKTNKIRLSSFILALVMLLSVTFPAGATEAPTPPDNGEVSLEPDDFYIPEEAAAYIAEFFVEDIAASGNSAWTSDTKVLNTVTMYDETGLAPSAYSVELTQGYVVVSAYADVPNLILEWADDGAPVYSEAPIEPEEEIIFTSPLDYYVTDGETVETFQGEEVDAEQIPTVLQDSRDIENVGEVLLETIVEEKTEWLENNEAVAYAGRGVNTNPGDYVTDVFAYAKSAYDKSGTWECSAWKNYWEDYKYNIRDIDLPGYKNACGPIAITNIMKMYGARYNSTPANTLNRMSGSEIFHSIKGLMRTTWEPYWYNGIGLDSFHAAEYVQAAFKKYGKNDLITSGLKTLNAANALNTLAYSNKLMMIKLSGSDTQPYVYPHWVVGYAYTTLKNSISRDAKTFVKLCDGHYDYNVNSENRFVDVFLLEWTEYIEVEF